MRAFALTVVWLISIAHAGASLQDKLTDQLRLVPGSIEVMKTRQFSPAELSDLVRSSDLVVRAVVNRGQSRLSRNEQSIDTDYQVSVLDVYRGSQGTLAGTTINVWKPGGVVQIEGRSVKVSEDDFPPFLAGEEYILFLAADAGGGYAVVSGAQGAFRLAGGAAEQVSGKLKEERGALPVAPFVSEIRALALTDVPISPPGR